MLAAGRAGTALVVDDAAGGVVDPETVSRGEHHGQPAREALDKDAQADLSAFVHTVEKAVDEILDALE